MCFNAPVSAFTYMIGMIGSVALARKGLLAESLFTIVTVQMQLGEFILHLNDSCNSLNVLTTHCLIQVNHFEPVALWIGILIARRRNMPAFVHAIMCAFLIVSAVYTSFVINDECTLVTEGSGGHLYWAWNDAQFSTAYYTFFLFCLGMLAAYGLEYAMFYSAMNLSSYILSYMIYGSTKSVGAMWCFFAALSPWVTLAFVDIEKRGERDILRRLTTTSQIVEVQDVDMLTFSDTK
jgi:hypothetical protein